MRNKQTCLHVALLDVLKMDSELMAASKRHNPDYSQVSGYIPKSLALTFKSICVAKEVSISDALEGMVQEWVEQNSQQKQQLR